MKFLKEELPSREEAINLLVKYGCRPEVITHCIEVSKTAVKLAEALKEKGLNVNIKLVEVGALLHDIGRFKTHTIHHVVIGAEIARKENLPKEIIRIIERHAGGGISEKEAEKLGWEKKNYLPETLEEKIVCYADKRVESGRIVGINREIKKLKKELGENHPSIERLKKLHEEFERLLGDLDAILRDP